MATYRSAERVIPYKEKNVYAVLSDLSNLERARGSLPEALGHGMTFDADSCQVDVVPLGRIEFRVTNREPFRLIELEAKGLPVPLKIKIALSADNESLTRLALTADVELSLLLQPMISKPLQEMLDKVSEGLATLSYE